MSEKKRVLKRDRVPVSGVRTNLQLSERDMENFKDHHIHWFNDQNGRVEAALSAGYEFVKPEEAPSMGVGGLHDENSDLNSKVSKVVTRSGAPIRAYLMKLQKTWWLEDQAKKEEVNQKVDETLRSTEQGGQSIEGGYTPR